MLQLEWPVPQTGSLQPAGGLFIKVTATAHVIIDVTGYFSTNGALVFYPLPPCRVYLTDLPNIGSFGEPALAAGQTRTFPVAGNVNNCGVPMSAQAFFINFTVVPSGQLDYITALPAGQVPPSPPISTLNSIEGKIAANGSIVPSGANGAISVFATHATGLIADVSGYFAPEDGQSRSLLLTTVTPCQAMETMTGPAQETMAGGPIIGALEVRRVIAQTRCFQEVASRPSALVVTVKASPPAPLGFVTLWPTGIPLPFASLLNDLWNPNPPSNEVARAVTNGAVVATGADGDINLYATETIHIRIEVVGFFSREPQAAPNINVSLSGASTLLDINLGYIPLKKYLQASGSDFKGCGNRNLSIQQCVKLMFNNNPTLAPYHAANYRKQGVTGVRFFISAGDAFNIPAGGTPDPTTMTNLSLFFADLRTAGVQRVSPTIVLGYGWAGPLTQKVAATCTGNQSMFFFPWLPYGLTLVVTSHIGFPRESQAISR